VYHIVLIRYQFLISSFRRPGVDNIHMPWSLLPRTLHSHAQAPQPQAIGLPVTSSLTRVSHSTYSAHTLLSLPLSPAHTPEKHQTSTTSTHLPTSKHTHLTTHPSTCPLSGALRTRLGYVDHSKEVRSSNNAHST
jgi:hypothetical protein